MTHRDDFLAWVKTTLYEAELALHNGDAAPRRALWSRNEPVRSWVRGETPVGSMSWTALHLLGEEFLRLHGLRVRTAGV